MKNISVRYSNVNRYENVNNRVGNISDATLVANFDNKTIKGELYITYPRRNISLHESPIVGNSFNGKADAEKNFPFFLSQ
ncbi:transferrin-binding protein-like solute binding protein [Aggregatibacter actinomycetemcomitans]|nr:transferrin-binding protein-like solute binding protein [Aggregatibacter actinomycetemcomitans]